MPNENLQIVRIRIRTRQPPEDTRKLSIGEQCLTSLLIGSIISSAIKNIFISKSRSRCTSTTIKRSNTCMIISPIVSMMNLCASSDPLQQRYTSDRRRTVTVEGPIEVIVDNCDTQLSNSSGMVFTLNMATIETYSKRPVETVLHTIPSISKADMLNPIYFDKEYDIIYYRGKSKPLRPSLPQHDLPDQYFESRLKMHILRECLRYGLYLSMVQDECLSIAQ